MLKRSFGVRVVRVVREAISRGFVIGITFWIIENIKYRISWAFGGMK